MAIMSSADTICLFDVDGTLTKPRQAMHILLLLICVEHRRYRVFHITGVFIHKISQS